MLLLYTDKITEEAQLEETTLVLSMLNCTSYRVTIEWVAALEVWSVLIKDKYTLFKVNRLTKAPVPICSTQEIFKTFTEDKRSIIATIMDYPS